MTQSQVYVSLEFTPNLNTLKYSVNRTLLAQGAANYPKQELAEAHSPLAKKLFEIAGICGVMIGKDFVTVSKTDDGDWDVVHKNTSKILEDHLNQDLPVFSDPNSTGVATQVQGGGQTEIEKKIIAILDSDIRPAVAMDGGDITFDKFEDGVVYLYLQGSCAGCPSSTMTLKQGIETRLKDAIPEVKEVVSI